MSNKHTIESMVLVFNPKMSLQFDFSENVRYCPDCGQPLTPVRRRSRTLFECRNEECSLICVWIDEDGVKHVNRQPLFGYW